MASGHENRANRSNTWLHRPAANVKKTLANEAPSTHGTSPTSLASPHMSTFGGFVDRPGIAPDGRD